MIHELQHVLGLCGEKHPSIIFFLTEWQNIVPIFNHIKTILK
jgi:hypothetical protein